MTVRFAAIHALFLAIAAIASIPSANAATIKNADVTCEIQRRHIFLDPDKNGQFTKEQLDLMAYSETEWLCKDLTDNEHPIYSIMGKQRDEKMFEDANIQIEPGVIVKFRKVDLLIPSSFPKHIPQLKVKSQTAIQVLDNLSKGGGRRLNSVAGKSFVQNGDVVVLRVLDSLGVGPDASAEKLSDDLFCTYGLTATDQQQCVMNQYNNCSGGQYNLRKTPKDTDGVIDIRLPNPWSYYDQFTCPQTTVEQAINNARISTLGSLGWTQTDLDNGRIERGDR